MFLFLFRFMCILFSDVVLFRSGTEKQLMRNPSIADKFTLKFVFFFLLFLFSFFFLLLMPCLRKRSLRQRLEIADIHISAEPSRDLSTNILSVLVCLQFFLSSNPPSHPPPRSAPIGSRSCSTGRLLAPSRGNLSGAAHICPRTSRSPAFCLWMDDTESEARDRR